MRSRGDGDHGHAGAGLLELVDALPVPALVACGNERDAARGADALRPAKGADPGAVEELERRFRAREELVLQHKPHTGAAGGLGAALASLGAELVSGASYVLDAVGFDASTFDLVVTGEEGRVDATTPLPEGPWRGRAPRGRHALRRLRRHRRTGCPGGDNRCPVWRPRAGERRPR